SQASAMVASPEPECQLAAGPLRGQSSSSMPPPLEIIAAILPQCSGRWPRTAAATSGDVHEDVSQVAPLANQLGHELLIGGARPQPLEHRVSLGGGVWDSTSASGAERA
ncbi:unnamed protein product, partial [Effrenium voratum]